MFSPLQKFVEEVGDPQWRLRSEQVLSALYQRAGPNAVNAIEPLLLPDGSLGIGANHQRSRIHLGAAVFFLLIATLFVPGVVFPANQSDIGEQIWSYVVPCPFLCIGVFAMYLYIKTPGPDCLLMVDPLGGYAAWRTGLNSRPRQARFSWSDHELRFHFDTVTQFNAFIHFVRVSRAPRGGGVARRLFSVRLDETARDYWVRFATEATDYMRPSR